jgi:quinone-modifying oxidoreductase subunit QmoA
MSEQDVLIIGGGISGITAAVEIAESGHNVTIVEKNPYLGGRVAQLNKYFPKLCPPICGLEMNFRRIKENGQIQFHTQSEVAALSGTEGAYAATITVTPRYVNDKCTNCGACADVCPAERTNEFNLGMDKTKAAYLPFGQAFPAIHTIDRAACKEGCTACVDACKYNAIDLDMQAETVELNAAAVIQATGWKPYDASQISTLDYSVTNVVSNMEMERLAAANGPTGGKIVRPSDGKEVKNVAFVQCAGSRDENHLAYCSYVCCMASLKQTTYVREQYEDSTAEIFYIDMRTPGRYEKFYNTVKSDENVTLTKGKVANVVEESNGDVTVTVEDILKGKKIQKTFDMVVLATGMQPNGAASQVPGISYTDEGFAAPAAQSAGIQVIGTAKAPIDVQRSVQSATAAALKSLQTLRRGAK